MQRFRIDLIGPFGLFAPDGARIDISSRKSVALLALLAASPGGVRARSWLQTMLWGSRGPEQAQASLRRELSNLGKNLAAHGAAGLLVRETQRIALALDAVDIDILSLGMKLPGAGLQFRGDFLEGLDLPDCEAFEDWLRHERERICAMVDLVIPATQAPVADAEQIMGSRFDARDLLGNRPPSLPPKPSLAVLPFANLVTGHARGDDAHAWLGAAMADEVAMLLSQYPQLFIVSSTAARELSAAGLRKADIAVQLGVRYLLEGNVRRTGNRLRVGITLLEGASSEQIWGQGFDGEMGDLHAVQQRIASQIAPQIWTKVDSAERSRGLRHTPMVANNYSLYWRANALFRGWQRDDLAEAIVLTRQALDNDPTCPWAASLAAFCYGLTYLLGFADDRAAARHQAVTHYQSALRFGEDNVEVIGYAIGTLVVIGGDMAVADRLVAHALSLLPAHQPSLFWGGWSDIVSGNAARARERFELALRLNPASGVRSQTLCGIGFAALLDGKPADAQLFLADAIRSTPVFFLAPICLCIAASLSGDRETALGCAQMVQFMDYENILGVVQNPAQRALLLGTLEQAIRELSAQG
jgi:TolB-like protein